jgi:hypothetical protein
MKACIRFAPVYTGERVQRGVKPGRTLYSRGSLTFLPGRSSVPLLVDHDKGREVGVVHELVEWDDVDGPWIVARATISDAPGWLKRGIKASFSFATLQRQEMDGWEHVRRALLTEVSVLPPSVRPAEPLAEVLLLKRTSPVRPASGAAAGEVIHHPPGGVLVRPNIGRVTGIDLGAGGWLEFEEVR